ncbi:MAG: hypothetical protein ACLQVY_20230 [Limisphaerales bacterium]
MKPCSKYREQIALLAIDGLERQPKKNLITHLNVCAGCRAYLEEISGLAGILREAEPKSDSQPSPSFHCRVRNALATTESSRDETFLKRICQGWTWRLALGAAGALVVLIAAGLLAAPHFHTVVSAPALALSGGKSPRKMDLEPTLSNYEMAVHQSFDSLDELLNAQGNHTAPPPPIYTLSQSSRLNAAD